MTSKEGLSESAVYTIQSIKPSIIYIAGGPAVLPYDVVQSIMGITGLSANKVIRLSGQDRYDTSLAIVKYFNIDTKNAVIASGDNFPDALAGSPLAAKNNAPIILLGSDASRQRAYLKSVGINNLTFLGGDVVMTNAKMNSLTTDTPPAQPTQPTNQTQPSSNNGGSSWRDHVQSGGSVVDDPNFHVHD